MSDAFSGVWALPDAKVEQIIYKARALYPGIMDLACWEIGRNWCKRSKPACGGCYMNDVCGAAVQLNRSRV